MNIVKKLSAVIGIFSFLLLVLSPLPVVAANFRSGESITISERLKDLYVSGGNVDVTAPIENDLVAAGGTVKIEGNVTNSILVAGGNITLSGDVQNTVRAAGSTIVIDSTIQNDLLVAGRTIDINDEAQIGGDLVITGGTLRINAPIQGNIYVTGGDVEINSRINGNVWGGNVEKLRLGPNAVIGGDLNYTSSERAQIATGAVVNGKQNFKQIENSNSNQEDDRGALAGLLTAGTLYKLSADILVTLFFIWLLPRFFRKTNETIVAKPLVAGIVGFGTLTLMPILSLILLIFLWLGVASFLLYALLLILSMIILKAFVGWFVLRWWYSRDKKRYDLDWKAAIVGPLIILILWFIPIIGWFIIFILWLLSIGAFVLQLWDYVNYNRTNNGKLIETRPAARIDTPSIQTGSSKPTRETPSKRK